MKKRSTHFAGPAGFEAANLDGAATARVAAAPVEAVPALQVPVAKADLTPEPLGVIPPEEPSFALSPDPAPLHPLEERVRRLENAMKEIQETRVTDRPAPSPPPPAALPPPSPVVATDVALPPAVAAPPPPPLPAPSPAEKRRWLIAEIVTEARAIQFMFFDPRYRMSWGGRLLPMLLLAAFLLTGWLPFTSVPGLGWLIQKAAELILGFILFKVLSHEARRYRETAPELPRSLRL